MRTKALLVDAQSGMKGPRVNLERGVWEIVAHPYVGVDFQGEGRMKHLNGFVRIVGPGTVALSVNPKYAGPSINSQARQVEEIEE